jgi:hypothetical protein
MVEKLLRCLDPRWKPQLEVPVKHPSRGVIDVVLTDRSSPVAVAAEVQSELRRLEQQIRWSTEKADGLRESLERDRPGLTVALRPIPVACQTTMGRMGHRRATPALRGLTPR